MLIPSPFLGAAVWQPVAEILRGRRRAVSVVGYPDPPGSPDQVLAVLLGQVPADEGLVLVPHSNAGLYVAALAARRPVSDVLFVDALLPGDTEATQVASPAFADSVAGLADEHGLLPPWTTWWDDSEELFPDAVSQRRVEAEQHRVPLGYLRGTVPTPAGWETARTSYLGFGDTYAHEVAEATRRGWPVRTLPGRHLHMLVRPREVAVLIDELTEQG